eukprot:COSAG04_NODE_224_length_19624_cov_47.932855_20_plen_274_part_00
MAAATTAHPTMTHNLGHANGGGFLLGSAGSEEPWLADGLDHDAMLEYTSSALDTLSLDAPFLPTADPAADPATAPTGLPLEEETAADESGIGELERCTTQLLEEFLPPSPHDEEIEPLDELGAVPAGPSPRPTGAAAAPPAAPAAPPWVPTTTAAEVGLETLGLSAGTKLPCPVHTWVAGILYTIASDPSLSGSDGSLTGLTLVRLHKPFPSSAFVQTSCAACTSPASSFPPPLAPLPLLLNPLPLLLPLLLTLVRTAGAGHTARRAHRALQG